jgi:hypothetical protein
MVNDAVIAAQSLWYRVAAVNLARFGKHLDKLRHIARMNAMM